MIIFIEISMFGFIEISGGDWMILAGICVDVYGKLIDRDDLRYVCFIDRECKR